MTNPLTSEFCWLLGKLKNPVTGESLGEFKKARPGGWGRGEAGRGRLAAVLILHQMLQGYPN